jgi:flagellar assembly factor FliW
MSESSATVTISHASGTLEVPAEYVVHFREALWGFPDRLDYVLLPTARQGVWWMISVGEPVVTFVLADPFVSHADYAIDLGDTERTMLGLTDPTDAFALVMVTLPSAAGEPATANLRAPIVFNLADRRAAQIVHRDESHSLRAPIDLAVYPPQENGFRLG